MTVREQIIEWVQDAKYVIAPPQLFPGYKSPYGCIFATAKWFCDHLTHQHFANSFEEWNPGNNKIHLELTPEFFAPEQVCMKITSQTKIHQTSKNKQYQGIRIMQPAGLHWEYYSMSVIEQCRKYGYLSIIDEIWFREGVDLNCSERVKQDLNNCFE